MSLILSSYEERNDSLAHGVVLCTKEETENSLMHYRVGGEKKGVLRWQDKDGNITPAGYKHYAEMYGWGKKVKKAQKLQNKADKARHKSEEANYHAIDMKLKSDRAANKAQHKISPRNIAKAEKYATKSDSAVEKAMVKSMQAHDAQKAAVRYANKLQRKEDKMLKYVDENGQLTDKAANKYTKLDAKTGERKMGLIGKIKFGKEYSDKYEKTYAEEKAKEKAEIEKQRDTVVKNLDDTANDLMSVDFDKLKPDKQKELGDSVLRAVTEARNLSATGDIDIGKGTDGANYDTITTWLDNRILEKVGSWNGEDWVKGSNAEKVYSRVDDAYSKMSDRSTEIRKSIGFDRGRLGDKSKKDYERLKQALQKDSVWTKLKEISEGAEKDLAGAFLKDIGFPDTPENRSMIWPFMYYD